MLKTLMVASGEGPFIYYSSIVCLVSNICTIGCSLFSVYILINKTSIFSNMQ